ncbi:MAG: YncE family protein [Bacteroidia bacterium]|nr:YncE family protein [Bacteroidia bacterium]
MRVRIKNIVLLLSFVMFFKLTACRTDEPVHKSETETKEEGDSLAVVKGFYLLNEGNMGSNKASLDYYSYITGIYSRNIFAERNPNVTKELGDVGNDLKIYGSKLYAIINCSNLVEVMDAVTGIHIATIEIPNCRYICFNKDKAYVSSYAGPVQIGNKQLGFVAEIDTATLQITRNVTVGYNPEEMAIIDNKMYVANSGGYLVPDYDNTLSIIDLDSFTEIKKVEVAINMHRVRADKYGDLYLSTRGDYYTMPANLFLFDVETQTIKKTFDIPVGNMCIVGDSAYLYSVGFNWNTGLDEISYALIDIKSEEVLSRSFIADGTESLIKLPYGIAVNPNNKEIFVTDAGDYVSPGTLYCFDKAGYLKWKQTTGDIPAHIEFTFK